MMSYQQQKVEAVNMDEGARHRLRVATLGALVSVSYIFAVRTLGTIVPSIFRSLIIAQIITVTSFIASLIMLYFFVVFYSHYVGKEQVRLGGATLLVILGRCAILLIYIKTLLRVFSVYILTHFVYSHHVADYLFPWANSLFTFTFFFVFHQTVTSNGSNYLERPTLFAAIGACAITLIQTFTLVGYLFSGGMTFLGHLPEFVNVLFYVIYILNFCTAIYFFISFNKELSSAATTSSIVS